MAATTTARQWQTPLPWSWSHFAYERLGLARGAALFLASLGLYLRFRPPSLDDWDSVNFVRAIGYFDMRLQQPHPPGYPAYVFLARFVNWFTHDPQLALTLLSAVCGALCVLVFYQLAAGFGAGLAALPLAVMPLFWVLSEMALSDMPGLLFAVTAVWLLSRAALRAPDGPWRRDLALGFAVAGLGAGVRPQDASCRSRSPCSTPCRCCWPGRAGRPSTSSSSRPAPAWAAACCGPFHWGPASTGSCAS